ncbi:MAG: hypothetical protein ACOCZ3_04810 [Bacillota bacterium]
MVKQSSGEINFYIGRNIILFGYHIHHFYFGILLMGIAGWMSIVGVSYISGKKLALIYGTGLGLLMDEIGLLLTWGDYYSSLSYLLGIFLLGIFLNLIYFPAFWEKVSKDLVGGRLKQYLWDPLYQLADSASKLIVARKYIFKYIIYGIVIFLILDVLVSRLF